MAQRVFLSSKQVFLDIKGTPEHENFLFKQIFDSLLKPTKIVENGQERVIDEGKELSITPRGKMNLSGGRKGYIIAVNHGRCGICGLFFYEEGDEYMTEMVDPHVADVARVVTEVE